MLPIAMKPKSKSRNAKYEYVFPGKDKGLRVRSSGSNNGARTITDILDTPAKQLVAYIVVLAFVGSLVFVGVRVGHNPEGFMLDKA